MRKENKPIITGYINIYEDISKINAKKIKTYSNWFDCEYYTIDIFDGYFIIKKCFLEIPKSAKKIGKKNKQIAITSDLLPLGTFELSNEENTIDELIIYFDY